MLIYNFFIKINKLIFIILHFRAIPFILWNVLNIIALCISVDTNLKIFSLISIHSNRSYGVFNRFKRFINIVISIKKGTFICSFKSRNTLFGRSNDPFNVWIEFNNNFMYIHSRYLLGYFLQLLGQNIWGSNINNQIESAEFYFAWCIFSSIQNIKY